MNKTLIYSAMTGSLIYVAATNYMWLLINKKLEYVFFPFKVRNNFEYNIINPGFVIGTCIGIIINSRES